MCQHLGYSPDDFIRESDKNSDKKRVIAVMEYWISAAEKEGYPKTWSMFAEEILHIIDPTMSSEICDSLRSEGIHLSEFTSCVYMY